MWPIFLFFFSVLAFSLRVVKSRSEEFFILQQFFPNTLKQVRRERRENEVCLWYTMNVLYFIFCTHVQQKRGTHTATTTTTQRLVYKNTKTRTKIHNIHIQHAITTKQFTIIEKLSSSHFRILRTQTLDYELAQPCSNDFQESTYLLPRQ